MTNSEQGKGLSGPDLGRIEMKRTQLYHRVREFMETYEFMILPVSQVPPFNVKERWVKEINGVKLVTVKCPDLTPLTFRFFSRFLCQSELPVSTSTATVCFDRLPNIKPDVAHFKRRHVSGFSLAGHVRRDTAGKPLKFFFSLFRVCYCHC